MFALALLAATAAAPPNVVVILADDLGFSDLGCYGSEIPTPHLDRLAAGGTRIPQFYNAARCCPTRAALLSGLYPHQAGVGHMLQAWRPPAYSGGLGANARTLAQALGGAGYRCYHVGKWHVGGVEGGSPANHPLERGFHRAYGTGGGGSFYAPRPLYLDRDAVKPSGDYYATDAFTDNAVSFLREHKDGPFFLHLCYTAPHFPLHARPAEVANHRGKYLGGWDRMRESRFARQKAVGLFPPGAELSPRDPAARAWADVPAAERDDWDARMATHAAMVERMDRGVGRVVAELERRNALSDTLVLFLSDNGASAEALDSWPDPARGHRPGSPVGSPESHRCLEVGWANAANTPFREHKMWCHEGGVRTPLIAHWPATIRPRPWTPGVGHIIDIMPTVLELAGAKHPDGRTPLPGRSLLPALRGETPPARTLAWEHEGNRAVRRGDRKLVARFNGPWELYDLASDPTELRDLAAREPAEAESLRAEWDRWAAEVGVVPWAELPGANYKPGAKYRKKSEP